jgi:hypothetical protein
LIATGVIFIGAIWTLAQVWPSGWSWGVGHSHFWPMILGVYATLGFFLIKASRDPLANQSLIWFAVWSSVVHAFDHGRLGGRRPGRAGAPGGGRAGIAGRGRRAHVLTLRVVQTETANLGFRRVA